MEYKIWRQLIQMLSFREDLIDTIKPFLNSLKNHNNEQYDINEEKHIPFLKSLSKFYLNKLHSSKIINEEKYQAFISQKVSTNDWYKEKPKPIYETVEEILKKDKLDDFKLLILNKGIDSISPNPKSFNEVEEKSIPIIHDCLIHNAIRCFKYLLINGIDPTKRIQERQSSDLFLLANFNHFIEIKIYEWDCMTLAIYYGQVEIMKILEEFGIEKGNNPEHIEAAVLSYRNSTIKSIINKLKENNEDPIKINHFFLIGLLASGRSNYIKWGEYFIDNGEKKNIEQINILEMFHFTLQNNSLEMFELLLSKGASIDVKGFFNLSIMVLLLIKDI